MPFTMETEYISTWTYNKTQSILRFNYYLFSKVAIIDLTWGRYE